MSALRKTHSPIRTSRTSAVSACRGQLCGAIPLALRVRSIRRAATRLTVSISVAVLVVMAPVMPTPTASASTCPPEKTCSTALIMGGTIIPT
jgi:hypothetical protein